MSLPPGVAAAAAAAAAGESETAAIGAGGTGVVSAVCQLIAPTASSPPFSAKGVGSNSSDGSSTLLFFGRWVAEMEKRRERESR